MLTIERVDACKRLIDIVLHIYNNKIESNKVNYASTSMEAKYSPYNIWGSLSSEFNTILRDKSDDWFIISVHPESEPGNVRRANCHTSYTPSGCMTCTYTSSPTPSLLLQDTGTIVEALSCSVDDDGDIFQIQTLHDDQISLCLILEYYLRNKIEEHFYVPINIYHLLNMDVDRIENLVRYWNHILYNEFG